MVAPLTIADVAREASELYADSPATIRYKQGLRPYICPFHVLVGFVDPAARVLDVGCGSGLFLALLVRLRAVRSAIGFDASKPAIAVAQRVSERLQAPDIRFEYRDARMPWPEGRFDVVSMIDVMHHVPPEAHRQIVASAGQRVAEGGVFLYKDMARRPLWRAWANRLHDLLLTGERIHYAKLDEVVAWAKAEGMEPEQSGAMNMLWYRHEWVVFRRRTPLKK